MFTKNQYNEYMIMKNPIIKRLPAGMLIYLLCLAGLSFSASAQQGKAAKEKYVIIGYVGGYRGLVDTGMVDANKLTHINYAFVNVEHTLAVLTNLKTDSTNFR